VSKTMYLADGRYTFETTYTYGDGICYQYGAGDFNVTVNGEEGAISSSGEFRDVVREIFDVVGLSTFITVDYRLGVVYDGYLYAKSRSLLLPNVIPISFGIEFVLCEYGYQRDWVIGVEHLKYGDHLVECGTRDELYGDY
jgi:hypothetical protein